MLIRSEFLLIFTDSTKNQNSKDTNHLYNPKKPIFDSSSVKKLKVNKIFDKKNMDQCKVNVELVKSVLQRRGYKLEDCLGAGSYAMVFKVYSFQYNQFFAAKIFYVGASQMTKNLQSFQAEITALSKIYHPYVINVYSYFNESDHLFIILDFCDNGSILDYIKNQQFINPPMVFSWMKQATEGLAACHNIGIAHRDIKPSNILIDKHNRIKIADFGFSLFSENDELIRGAGGSFTYSSPEMMRGESYDPFKADVWALGISFYSLIFGKTPYSAQTEEHLRTQIREAKFLIPGTCDKKFQIILGMMLKPNPSERATLQDILTIFNYIRTKKTATLSSPKVVRVKSQKYKSVRIETPTPTRPPMIQRRKSTIVDDAKDFVGNV